MASEKTVARPGRINITLDLATQGAKRKKELPMKCLVVGNFSKGQSKEPASKRKRVSVTKDNFSGVLESVNPHLTCCDGEVQLSIQSMRDFHPEGLVEQVPELRRLVAMRHLLRDLQANLLDNRELQKQLTTLTETSSARLALKHALDEHAPMQRE